MTRETQLAFFAVTAELGVLGVIDVGSSSVSQQQQAYSKTVDITAQQAVLLHPRTNKE